MKVAYLSGTYLAVSSIRMMLIEQFGRSSVHELHSLQLATTDLSAYDMLVLPGSTGEVSPYPDILGQPELMNLFDAVENNGLILWTDCSATYYMLNDIEYISSLGLRKTRLGLGRIDGKARGPVKGKAVEPSSNSRFAEVLVRRIAYKIAGKISNAEVCYGNGPGLHLSEAERQNPDVNILAVYDDAPDRPVAALTKRIGNGLLVSLGVLVQIGPEHLNGQFSEKDAEDHRRSLFNHLSHSDNGRQEFLSLLFRQVRNHYKFLKNQGTTYLSYGVQHADFP